MPTLTICRRAAWSMLAGIGLAMPARAAGQITHRIVARDTSTWAGVGAQLRWRGEAWSSYNAGMPASAPHDDVFGLSRLLLRAEVHVGGVFGVFGELKSSIAEGRILVGGSRPSDEDRLDVQQLYGDLNLSFAGARATMRMGRFDLALGRERLVSPLDWTNSRRTFEGGMARVQRGAVEAIGFWVRPVIVMSSQLNVVDSSRQLFGAQLALTTSRGKIEAYWLRNEWSLAGFNGTSGPERRHTLGVRVSRAPARHRLDGDIEAAWQAGSTGGQPVRAWMVGSQVGYLIDDSPALRVYAGIDAGSGDRDSGGTVQTFNQLYPLGHAFLGFADVHGRQNVVAVSAGASLRPRASLSLQLDVHDFRRASANDGLYGVEGSLSRTAGSGRSMHVGSELDLTARQSVAGGRMLIQVGASRYFAGEFMRQAGPSENISWVYGQITATY